MLTVTVKIKHKMKSLSLLLFFMVLYVLIFLRTFNEADNHATLVERNNLKKRVQEKQ